MTHAEIEEQIKRLGPWFYEFDLGNGHRTLSSVPPEVRRIFTTRLDMVERLVDEHFGSRLADSRCMDIGCHEGLYSIALAKKGMQCVLGVDVREESLRKARFVRHVLGFQDVSFQQANCETVSPEAFGRFELTLFLGLLYHLENPMRCLRNISSVTTELCIVETQVVDEVEGKAEWGAKQWTREYQGVLALIDESAEYEANNSETGATPIAMCPSPNALAFMLRQAGFRRVEVVEPPPDAYEQHQRRKRVVCAAYK